MSSTQEQRFRGEVKRIIQAAVPMDCAILEEVLSQPLDSIVKNSRHQLENLGPDYNYQERALVVLVNVTFDLLSSGQYHIYRGTLSPVGSKMFTLYEHCIAVAADSGYITKDQMYDQIELLMENIDSVG